MDVYLAASYSRRLEMREWRRALENSLEHSVISSWLDDDKDWQDCDQSLIPAMAEQDLQDALMASWVILALPVSETSGAHIAFGAALGMYNRVSIVGEPTALHHWHPRVERYATFADLLTDNG